MTTDNKLREAVFTEINVRDKYDWARVLLERTRARVVIISSYGEWSYYWSHPGESLPELLLDVCSSYLGEKLLGSRLMEYDDEKTWENIRRWILQYRREGCITRDRAREEWDLVDSCDSFADWCGETSFGDPWELQVKSMAGTWQSFWSRIWEPLVLPVIRENLEELKKLHEYKRED